MRWSSWKEIVHLIHWCCCHLQCVIWWLHLLCILDSLSHMPHHSRCLEVWCCFVFCRFHLNVKLSDHETLKCSCSRYSTMLYLGKNELHILRFLMEFIGQIYWPSTIRQLTGGGPPAWELDEGLTTPHCKKLFVGKCYMGQWTLVNMIMSLQVP